MVLSANIFCLEMLYRRFCWLLTSHKFDGQATTSNVMPTFFFSTPKWVVLGVSKGVKSAPPWGKCPQQKLHLNRGLTELLNHRRFLTEMMLAKFETSKPLNNCEQDKSEQSLWNEWQLWSIGLVNKLLK